MLASVCGIGALQLQLAKLQQDSETGSCMQIAQIAPLTEAIPPKLYGGTERVISWLTDELVALGHEVVLFASGDSRAEGTASGRLSPRSKCIAHGHA